MEGVEDQQPWMPRPWSRRPIDEGLRRLMASTTKETYNCGSLAMETHNRGVFGHGSHDPSL
ncbi:hypothetical protein FH972_017606 [Carpinus fangiana]|uniref:Uncharacterized protein n=1 Tax=Carpinus fangiana TaxID=176857 RepID=A0A5N6RJN6_9ROSI|nr:hypothetical protein FH972_017606 [Carpinus fangiana]